MDCHETTDLLQAYGDGELDPVRSAALERHLLGCTECTARRDELTALSARVRSEVPYHRAPQAVRARALSALDAVVSAETRTVRPRERWGWLSGGALAGCAATVLAWFVGTTVLDWQAEHDLVTEAVTNHTRATLAGGSIISIATRSPPWSIATGCTTSTCSSGHSLQSLRLLRRQVSRRSAASTWSTIAGPGWNGGPCRMLTPRC